MWEIKRAEASQSERENAKERRGEVKECMIGWCRRKIVAKKLRKNELMQALMQRL